MKKNKSTNKFTTDTTILHIADEDGLLNYPVRKNHSNNQKEFRRNVAISSGNRYEILADLEENTEYIIQLFQLPNKLGYAHGNNVGTVENQDYWDLMSNKTIKLLRKSI